MTGLRLQFAQFFTLAASALTIGWAVLQLINAGQQAFQHAIAQITQVVR